MAIRNCLESGGPYHLNPLAKRSLEFGINVPAASDKTVE